jgi:hypothetical protein
MRSPSALTRIAAALAIAIAIAIAIALAEVLLAS